MNRDGSARLAQTLSREYNLAALSAAGTGMPYETLRFRGVGGAIRSLTIDNGSNCDAGVFLNRDPAGVPSYIVAAGTYKTQPVNAAIIGLAFAPPIADQPRGTAYVNCSDELLSASSGVSGAAITATAVWDVSTFDSGAKAS